LFIDPRSIEMLKKFYKTAKVICGLMLVLSVLGFTDAGTALGNSVGVPVKPIAQGAVLYTGYGIHKAYDWTKSTNYLDSLYALGGALGAVFVMRKLRKLPKSRKVFGVKIYGVGSVEKPKGIDNHVGLSTFGLELLVAARKAMEKVRADGAHELTEAGYRTIARAMHKQAKAMAEGTQLSC